MENLKMQIRISTVLLLLVTVMCFTSCGSSEEEGLKEKSWNVMDYEQREDIINIDEIADDKNEEIVTYSISLYHL